MMKIFKYIIENTIAEFGKMRPREGKPIRHHNLLEGNLE
jgi:hypothetical protein